MDVIDTRLDGPLLLQPKVFGDTRGFFVETYRAGDWAAAGVAETFVQDNHSRSGRGVVRGMHFAVGDGQGKLVRAARGRILDVVVDLRRASPTFGEWESHELDDLSGRQLYVPVGFAHGFFVLSDVADVVYKVSSYYDPAVEQGFKWDDPEVGIAWPADVEPVFSQRDADAPLLSEIEDGLPF
ncbi:MAG: dTDP-4-dehydrorhamnose 3,5-epimerase [Conexibacter sp.]|nr:dTDP-4-dehydrorhamnose 3,5-epimerase [Conexibacter sp.]